MTHLGRGRACELIHGRRSVVVSSILGALVLATAADVNANLPKELSERAAKHGCAEVASFFDRPGMVEPPFVYGYLSGKAKSDSAIFWCQLSKRKYQLIAFARDEKEGDCAGVILETSNFPGGLSIAPFDPDSANGYRPIEGGASATSGPAVGGKVSSMYDGVGTSFVCLQGRWFMRRWD